MQTIKKIAAFFNVETDMLIEKKNTEKQQHFSSWQKTTIHWNLIEELSHSEQHQKLSNLCIELRSVLNEYTEDEQVKTIFLHG